MIHLHVILDVPGNVGTTCHRLSVIVIVITSGSCDRCKLLFTGWSFLCSKSNMLGSPFKRGEQHHYWWQWRVDHLQSWPRGGRGRGWERLTGWKRGRNGETDHARGVRDTCTAENFIICHIASLVFMEGSKLDICNTGQKIYIIHWLVKTSIFLLNVLGFFISFRLKCQLSRKFQC